MIWITPVTDRHLVNMNILNIDGRCSSIEINHSNCVSIWIRIWVAGGHKSLHSISKMLDKKNNTEKKRKKKSNKVWRMKIIEWRVEEKTPTHDPHKLLAKWPRFLCVCVLRLCVYQINLVALNWYTWLVCRYVTKVSSVRKEKQQQKRSSERKSALNLALR